MSEEFKEDIGKEVKFFLKIGRVYSGKIKSISKNGFIKLIDKFDKPVKVAEDNIGSVEYN